MQKLWLVFSLLLLSFNWSVAQPARFNPPPSDRVKINIDFDWKFIRGDFVAEEETHQVNQLPWQKVNLPHDWSIEGPYCETNNTTQGFLPMGIGWYKKGIYLSECYADRKVFIIFDGVYRSSDVWMNYAHLGHHESGYTSFVYDLTDYVRFGNRIPNGLRVRVDGRRHEQDMYEGNGIYRHVWLLVTNKLHIGNWGIYVSTPEVSEKSATIRVQTTIINENNHPRPCKLITKIIDAQGQVVASKTSLTTLNAHQKFDFIQQMALRQPHLWSTEDPYLYRAYSIVETNDKVVDTDMTRFGIRFFHFDSNQGFFLNGKPLKLRGFNAHYDFAGLGTALPDRMHWNAMIAMKKAGFNFYRSSHNPATPERLDICDQIGMLVWDEIERKLESTAIEQELVRATIIRDRNHPSVILWSLENESPLEGTVYGTQILKDAVHLAHQLDPLRPTTFAASMPVNKKGYGEAIDVVSYNYHWKRADQDHRDYPHWKIGLISEYSAARARRGVYGIEKFPRAADDAYFDLYTGMVQSMYEMCQRVEESWQRIKARAYLGGGCVWSGIDAWGEGNAWPLVSRGDGALDLCLFPKDVYYYFVSQWTEKPMLHLFPHWNWDKNTNEIIDVWVYTNCDRAELFLNGRSLGAQVRYLTPESHDPLHNFDIHQNDSALKPEHLSWKVPYEAGTLAANGWRNGQIVCHREVKTASKPAKIRLSRAMTRFLEESEIPPLVADGRDVVVIRAEILDENELLVPTASNLIHFEVSGNGKNIGVGNGNIASHEPNQVNYRRAYNGLCAVIVETTSQPGKITLVARSEGLDEGKIFIYATPPAPSHIAVLAQPAVISSSDKTVTVTAEVRDGYGVVIPSATNDVTFESTGQAFFENHQPKIVATAVNGIARAELTLNNKSECILITAHSKNLSPGKIEVVRKN